MENQEGTEGAVRVALMGDRQTGKTFTARRLAGKEVQEYSETTQMNSYQNEQHDFVYVDYPKLESNSIIEIGQMHRFQRLVLLFKGCDSFTKLYEFLEQVKEVSEGCNKPEVQYYWSHIKRIYLVYTDFESPSPVQLNELFPILQEQIANFSRITIVMTIALRKQEDNFDELRSMIEDQLVQINFPPEFQKEKREESNSLDKYQGNTTENATEQKIDHPSEVEHVEVQEEKLVEERRSMIMQRIQKSFFLDQSSQKERNQDEEVPREYQNIQREEKNNDKPEDQAVKEDAQERDIEAKGSQRERDEKKEEDSHSEQKNEEGKVEQQGGEKESKSISEEKDDKDEKEDKGEKQEKEKREEEEEEEEQKKSEEDHKKVVKEEEGEEEKNKEEKKQEKKEEGQQQGERTVEKDQKKKDEEKGEGTVKKEEAVKQVTEDRKQKQFKEESNENLLNQRQKKVQIEKERKAEQAVKDSEKERELKSIAHEPAEVEKANPQPPRPESGMSPIKPGQKEQKGPEDPKSCKCLIM